MRVLPSVLAIAAMASSMATVSNATPLAGPPSLEPESVVFPRALQDLSRQPGASRSVADSPQDSPGVGSLLQRRGNSIGTQSLAELFGLTRTNRRKGIKSDGSPQSKRRRRHVGGEATSDVESSKHVRRAGTCSKKTASTSSKVAPTSTSKPSSSTSNQAAKTSSSSAAPAATSGVGGKSSSLVMGGYWPSWVNGELPPSAIDWTKFDIMCYAFATPNNDGTLNLDGADSLTSLVSAGHKGNTKVLLSIGGWGGSGGFSPSVASDTARAKFVKSIRAAYDKYNLDGIDLDWEYPNSQFAGTYNQWDTANFQTFLTALRAGLPNGALITAAVSQAPWLASNGSPVGSVARAASAIDYIMIMNYDVWGADSTPGPNAPLADLCGNSTQPGASAAAAVKQWSAAGMPRSKMLLGSPFYGYLSTSSKRTLKQRSLDGSSHTPGLYDSLTARAPARQLGHERDSSALTAAEQMGKRALNQADGQINFDKLISGGALKLSGSNYVADGGYTKYWDDCSDTPYLSNGKKVVTYDDPDSLYDKGSFAAQAGLGGSSVWSVDGDVSSWALTKALRSGMGLS
ncbi:unnamed protein product [Sympodiomycopsis kandeliae]